MKRSIDSPAAHFKKIGVRIPGSSLKKTPDNYWPSNVISVILDRQEYVGRTVNFKKYKKDFKSKRTYKTKCNEWKIFENTHESIIDINTCNSVQKIRENRIVRTPNNEILLFAGFVYCADCGSKLYQTRCKHLPKKWEYLTCGYYRNFHLKTYNAHSIRNVVLEKIVIDRIQNLIDLVKNDEEEFIELVRKQNKDSVDRELKVANKIVSDSKSRLNQIEKQIVGIYEDKNNGIRSLETFTNLMKNYENERT